MPQHKASPLTETARRALEKIFAAEIEGRLPYQSRSKVYLQLERDGLVAVMERIFPGRLSVVVTGWQLTHAGRYLYCLSCDDRDREATTIPDLPGV